MCGDGSIDIYGGTLRAGVLYASVKRSGKYNTFWVMWKDTLVLLDRQTPKHTVQSSLAIVKGAVSYTDSSTCSISAVRSSLASALKSSAGILGTEHTSGSRQTVNQTEKSGKQIELWLRKRPTVIRDLGRLGA